MQVTEAGIEAWAAARDASADQYGSLTDQEALVYMLACGICEGQPDHTSALGVFDEFMSEFFTDDEADGL